METRDDTDAVIVQLMAIDILAKRILGTRYQSLESISDDIQALNIAVQDLCADPVFGANLDDIPALRNSVETAMFATADALNYATAEVRRLDGRMIFPGTPSYTIH